MVVVDFAHPGGQPVLPLPQSALTQLFCCVSLFLLPAALYTLLKRAWPAQPHSHDNTVVMLVVGCSHITPPGTCTLPLFWPLLQQFTRLPHTLPRVRRLACASAVSMWFAHVMLSAFPVLATAATPVQWFVLGCPFGAVGVPSSWEHNMCLGPCLMH
jgi:hypothetical protein